MLKEIYNNVNYVTLNRPLIRESAKDNPSIFFEENKPPIIVDEIQKAAELFDYIKDIEGENKIPGTKVGVGAIVCLAKERLTLTEKVWVLPALNI
jgi:predicted AAA+ superfamily ATPase